MHQLLHKERQHSQGVHAPGMTDLNPSLCLELHLIFLLFFLGVCLILESLGDQVADVEAVRASGLSVVMMHMGFQGAVSRRVQLAQHLY